MSLVDALANTNQTNTGRTTIEDMNKITHDFKREGFGTGGFWEPWNQKGTRGREEIRMRLKNSTRVGKPFDNLVVDTDEVGNRRPRRLPTLWIMGNCKKTIEYMHKWRLQEHKDRDAKATKDQKESPQDKWSHMNMCWEALFKNEAFRAHKQGGSRKQSSPYDNYFRGRR